MFWSPRSSLATSRPAWVAPDPGSGRTHSALEVDGDRPGGGPQRSSGRILVEHMPPALMSRHIEDPVHDVCNLAFVTRCPICGEHVRRAAPSPHPTGRSTVGWRDKMNGRVV